MKGSSTRVLVIAALAALAAVSASSSSSAAVIVIDDFEANEGHFTTAPSFSGTTAGETETAAGVGPSTADRDTTQAFQGVASQRIFLDDNPTANAPDGTAWRLRHLSGGGTIANNTPLEANGFVGYYLLTTTPNLRASILIDDGTTGHLERGTRLPIIADGQWHLYQWNLDDETQWDAFAGTGANGVIDSTTTVTIDALYMDAVLTAGDQDAVFFIDNVSHNATGEIPEPAALGLLALAAPLALARRRRQK